jgi:hypothetical protein
MLRHLYQEYFVSLRQRSSAAVEDRVSAWVPGREAAVAPYHLGMVLCGTQGLRTENVVLGNRQTCIFASLACANGR